MKNVGVVSRGSRRWQHRSSSRRVNRGKVTSPGRVPLGPPIGTRQFDPRERCAALHLEDHNETIAMARREALLRQQRENESESED